MRNFLAQDIAESITRKVFFLGKILAARTLRGILRKKLAGRVTLTAFGNIAATLQKTVSFELTRHKSVIRNDGTTKEAGCSAAVILIHYKQQKRESVDGGYGHGLPVEMLWVPTII